MCYLTGLPGALNSFIIDTYELSTGRYIGSTTVSNSFVGRNDETDNIWSHQGNIYIAAQGKKWKLRKRRTAQ